MRRGTANIWRATPSRNNVERIVGVTHDRQNNDKSQSLSAPFVARFYTRSTVCANICPTRTTWAKARRRNCFRAIFVSERFRATLSCAVIAKRCTMSIRTRTKRDDVAVRPCPSFTRRRACTWTAFCCTNVLSATRCSSQRNRSPTTI